MGGKFFKFFNPGLVEFSRIWWGHGMGNRNAEQERPSAFAELWREKQAKAGLGHENARCRLVIRLKSFRTRSCFVSVFISLPLSFCWFLNNMGVKCGSTHQKG
jgi:hypothetical protein